MTDKIKWEASQGKYASGSDGMVNEIKCFGIHWSATIGKGSNTPPHVLTCKLPGFKVVIGNYESAETAQRVAKSVLNAWLKKIGLEFIE